MNATLECRGKYTITYWCLYSRGVFCRDRQGLEHHMDAGLFRTLQDTQQLDDDRETGLD